MCTWLFSTDAVCLSHMGLISIPRSRSLSPCRKNSSIMRSVHCLYTARGFVGLLRSAQCTMFLRTYTHTLVTKTFLFSGLHLQTHVIFDILVLNCFVALWRNTFVGNHLYSVIIMVQHQHSWTGHFLGLDHCLKICQQAHMLWHVCCQNLRRRAAPFMQEMKV